MITFHCLLSFSSNGLRQAMQAALTSRCFRIMNYCIHSRRFSRPPLAVLNPIGFALQSNRSSPFTGARSLPSKPSSFRTSSLAPKLNAFLSDFHSRPPQNLAKSQVVDVNNAKHSNLCGASFEFDNVHFSYVSERKILDGISVVVPAEKSLTTIGTSGSEKSTVLRLPFRFFHTRSGHIRFNGEVTRTIKQNSFRKTVGVVPQVTVHDASHRAPIQDTIINFWKKNSSMLGGRGLMAFTKTSLQLKQYHSSSDSEQHNPTFATVAKPSLPPLQHSPEADSLSQILIQHHNPFHHMESSIQLNGISLSPPLIHQTLLRLNHHSKIALAFFKYAQSHHPSTSPPLLDTAAYNIIIDIFCKVRQFDVAWQMILQMDNEESNSKPNFTTFFVLIRRLISSGLTRTAILDFYDIGIFLGNEIFEAQFSFYFCYLLDTLCKYGFVKVAVEVFNKEKYRVDVDAKLYTVLIYGWCKVGKTEMGKKFLGEMLERGIEPNVVTYNVLLNGICRHASLHPEGRFERVIREAEKVFDEMHDRGLEADVTTYSILLHVYSRGHKPQLCLDKLEMMKEKGIWPNLATYTSVIKCLCSCGRMEDAEELLNEMVHYGVSPTAETYNCFFKEYRGRKDVDGAMKLYMRMKEDNSLLSPDMHTYNILLGMFMKLGKMSLAWEIWNDINESGVGPDLDAYTVLVHGLCEKRKWKKACEFFMQMIEKGFLPQKVTFETLYRGLIQADKLRTWRRLKKKLEEESITFGSEFKEYHLKPYKR